MNPAVAYVRALADPDRGGLGDGELLARFAAGRDEDAFAELVRRHGRMVLGTCRRVLGGPGDADDCAQAVFVVLARRADQFAGRATVGDFLHGVAVRVALKARTRAAKRRTAEQHAARPAGFVAADAPDPIALAALDRAIQSLPARLRQAVVLCELEGVPRSDAAARLGVPAGTLSSRLAGARKKLAARLTAGGFTPTLLAAAAFPDTLAAAVVRSAVGSPGAVPAAVQLLVNEVTTAMMLSKLKPVLAAVMVAAALGAGVGVAQVGGGRESRPDPKAVPGPADNLAWFEMEKAEHRKLMGVWEPTGGSRNGKPVADPKQFGWSIGFFARSVMLSGFPIADYSRRPDKGDMYGYVVNFERTPKELTIYSDDRLMQCIYEVNADTLRIAHFGRPYLARPKGFKPADNPAGEQDLIVIELRPIRK